MPGDNSLPIIIDKTSRVPIYYQLQRGILDLIEAGALKPGDWLPSENELSRQYNISPMTVRQAMVELVNAGDVQRERGRGTFVAARHMEHALEQLVGFSEDMRSRKLAPGSRILVLEQVPPPPDVIMRVGLSPDVRMTRLKRVRLANDEPVGIHDSYLHGVTLSEADLARVPSLYQLLEERGIHLAEGEDAIEAVSASREVAALLQVKAGSPLLRTIRFSWDDQGKFVEYVTALYRADLYQYRIWLKRR